MVFHSDLGKNKSQGLAVDLEVSGSSTPTDLYLEAILDWYVTLYGEGEIVNAKEEFFDITGKVFYDDEMYQSRMHYFTCYFIFERPLNNNNSESFKLTPFELYLKKEPEAIVGGYTHSLFKVVKNHQSSLIVLDLLTKEKFKIQRQTDELLKGFNRGDYFQGFILHLNDFSVLSRGLVFHPQRAASAILQKIKTNKKQHGGWTPLETVTSFARLQLKHHRLKHVDPKLVYSESII
jgi:hypothetical protein